MRGVWRCGWVWRVPRERSPRRLGETKLVATQSRASADRAGPSRGGGHVEPTARPNRRPASSGERKLYLADAGSICARTDPPILGSRNGSLAVDRHSTPPTRLWCRPEATSAAPLLLHRDLAGAAWAGTRPIRSASRFKRTAPAGCARGCGERGFRTGSFSQFACAGRCKVATNGHRLRPSGRDGPSEGPARCCMVLDTAACEAFAPCWLPPGARIALRFFFFSYALSNALAGSESESCISVAHGRAEMVDVVHGC